MKFKTALIPIAAFAVTVSTASAFSTEVLEQAGLSNDQIAAFEQAKELRESGDKEAARDLLVEAGIDAETMESIREAMHEMRAERRSAIDEAVENEDFDAFLEAIAGSPLADIIDTEAEFQTFIEAHELMEAGEREEAKEIMEELGITHEGRGHGMMGKGGKDHKPPFFDQLTDEQKEEMKAAMEEHDHDKVKEILEAAGIELPEKSEGRGFGFGRGNQS